ncbi:MAG: hypothetical protein A2283_04320 [Lentisphaerae bacterium RIFOXYA12_FULL_48_11]|nr:MAG: hypothetical protein A2283_04320 [Lentisphaerae bacterium RIFOXYA12_FULL_48_11]
MADHKAENHICYLDENPKYGTFMHAQSTDAGRIKDCKEHKKKQPVHQSRAKIHQHQLIPSFSESEYCPEARLPAIEKHQKLIIAVT